MFLKSILRDRNRNSNHYTIIPLYFCVEFTDIFVESEIHRYKKNGHLFWKNPLSPIEKYNYKLFEKFQILNSKKNNF